MDERYVVPNYCSNGWSLYHNIADMLDEFRQGFPRTGELNSLRR